MATNPALTQQASRGRGDPVVIGLVTRAKNGEQLVSGPWSGRVARP